MAELAKRDFLRFRDRGDSKALARVFDVLAPRLLLIAAHVVADRAQAEDVVQETFLRVMREAGRYDASKPLFPWLVGILQNEARMARRTARRVPDPARVERVPDPDPLQEAGDRDLMEHLSKRMGTLPKPYRDVLNLRLVHGLRPVDIAHALGRRPGTVQTQLRRGLDRLRKILPAGLSVGSASVISTGRGMAAVRRAVLHAADHAAPGGVSAGKVVAGGLLTNGSRIGLACLVAGSLAWIAWSVPNRESTAQTEALAAASMGPQAGQPDLGTPGQAPTESPSTEPARNELEPPARATTAQENLVRVTGRCVVAETGQPLAGCTVKFTARSMNSSGYDEVDWQDPDPVITGADGRFEISFVAMPLSRARIEVQADDRAPRTASWFFFQSDQVEDLGDVSLHPGYELKGRVLDPLSNPVEGIRVTVQDVPSSINLENRDSYSGASDSWGHFSIRAPIPAGAWVVRATGRGWHHTSPRSVIVHEGIGAAPLQVAVKAMPAISGLVVDEAGRPARGVQVRGLPETPGSYPTTRAGEDGTFTLHATREDETGMRLRIGGGQGRASGPYEAFEDGRIHEWGSTNLHVVVRRALSLQLRVVESGTGESVESYSVASHSLSTAMVTREAPRLGGRHRDGQLTLTDVLRGRNRLVVLPRDPELLPAAIEFDALDPGLAPILVELDRMRRYPVRVVTEDGEPVASSTVELIHDVTGNFGVDDPVQRPRDGQTFWTIGWVAAEVLSNGRTDLSGQVSIPVPDVATELVLRVTGNTHLPTLMPAVQFPGDGGPMVIVVSASATLSGRVLLDGFEPRDVMVLLHHADGSQVRSRPDLGMVRVNPDGSFLQRGMDPGVYSLSLAIHGDGSDLKELEKLVLRAGETVDVEVDGRGYKPGTLRGRIFLDGVPLSDGRVWLDGPGIVSPTALDAEGRFVAEGLKAHSYGVEIQVGNHGSTKKILFDEVVDVEAGRELERDFHFTWRKMRIRLLEPDGTPLRNTLVAMRLGRTLDSKTTDGDGWIVLDPVLQSPVGILLDSGLLGPLEIPAGQKEATFELQIGK